MQNLEVEIRRYLHGAADLETLEDWLARNAASAAEGHDESFRQLHNAIWLKIGEFDEKLIDEAELVDSLASLLPSNQRLTWAGQSVATMASPSSSVDLRSARWQPAAVVAKPWLLATTR